MSYKFIPSKVNNSGKFLRVSTEGKLEWATSSGGGGVEDGNKGDITVSGNSWTVNNLSATKITEDSEHRFVTDTEKTTWNSKLNNYILTVKLENDLTTGSNQSMNIVSGFVFTYEANSTYRIHVHGAISTATSQAGVGLAFDVSSAVTNVWLQFYHQLNTNGGITGGSQVIDAVNYAVTSGTPASNAIIPIFATGLINTSVDTGTAQLQFRSEVNTAVTLKAGTIMIIEKI